MNSFSTSATAEGASWRRTPTPAVPHALTLPRTRKQTVQLINTPEELAHLVCCRDVSWERAFCGADTEHITMEFDMVCTMCIEVVETMAPGALFADPPHCPVDGAPCPESLAAVVDERINNGPFA